MMSDTCTPSFLQIRTSVLHCFSSRVLTKCAPGFIQVVPDAYSVDSLKKMHGVQTLGQVKHVAIAAVTSDAVYNRSACHSHTLF
jgi:hypothetical protein